MEQVPVLPPSRLWRPRDLAVGLGLLSLGYVGVVALLLFTGSQSDDVNDPATTFAVTVITLAFEIWLAAIVLILATRRDLSLEQLGFRPLGRKRWIAIAVFGAYGIVIAYSLGILLLERLTGTDLSRLMEGNGLPELPGATVAVWVVLGLSTVVAAPVCEELFFRSFVFRAMQQRWGLVAGLVGSGLFFSLVHLEPSVILPFWGIGALLAWAFHRSGSLWTTIAAHAIFNGIAFAVTLGEMA